MDKNLNTLCIPPSRTGEKYFNRQYTATVHDPDIPGFRHALLSLGREPDVTRRSAESTSEQRKRQRAGNPP
ncbi:MAG TPA: hypothetical protein H9991_03810, partial [Candidatus Mailhella excrementigallinarum]|nr:hypothetical protein [Candidatus Mailhella excrementigallinarum]